MKEKDNLQNGWGKKVFANGDTRNSSPKHANSPGSPIKKNKTMEKWAKDRNGRFSIEGTQVDIKYAKRCSASLIIREMQIKSSMRCHFTPASMAISKIRQQ